MNESFDKFMKVQGFSKMNDFRMDDIFIAGYPKSGNTWMQNLVTGIYLNSSSEYITPRLVGEIVPDVHVKKYFRRLIDPMVFKTHDFPRPEYKRVIHLVRDGRDVMVSYYNMGKNKNQNFEFTLKEMVIDGKGLEFSKWHLHITDWLQNPYNAEIMVLKYEDLILHPLREMKRISSFIGIELSDDRLIEIYNNNSLQRVRSRVKTYGMENDHTWKNKPITTFFRKGVIGSYKDEMPEELIEYFNEEAIETLRYFDYI